ncbi:hypothetical protein LA52FAK_45480 [Desulforhopalus sp. 52FAK]
MPIMVNKGVAFGVSNVLTPINGISTLEVHYGQYVEPTPFLIFCDTFTEVRY